MLRNLHNILAWLPLTWCILCLSSITIASIKLGHIPQYGLDPDPTELGLDTITFLAFLFFLASFCLAFAWPLLELNFIIDEKRQVNYWTLGAFILGIASFFIMKHIFPEQFNWFTD
jgi:hypothetical protein